jgi:two-component system, chemotaxis family, sensor kinase CheA
VGGAGDPLGELRQIFREELEDHVALLERERLVLEQPDADPAAQGRALAEIHRAVHSLKGAARAVGYPGIEQLGHAMETLLAPGRPTSPASSASPAPAGVAAVVRIAAQALRSSAADLAAGRLPDDRALLEARQRIAAPAPAAASEAPSHDGAASGPKPRSPSEPEPARPVPPSVEVAAPRPAETVRVSPARLGELLSASEEMLALAGRQGGAARWKPLDDLLGELRNELGRARFATRSEGLDRSPGSDDLLRRLDRSLSAVHTLSAWSIERQRDDTAAWQAHLSLAGEIAERARALRVVPFGSLLGAVERTAGDAAGAVGKRVEVGLVGGAIEIDRRVRDGLREPLLHLLRNAVDHGIEAPEARAAAGKPPAGRVEIAASLAGRDLRVTVDDDGRGVDVGAVRAAAAARGLEAQAGSPAELLALLCEPGLTTRAAVTPLSGRGVGLDVVRQRVAEMHGRVELESRPGRGARFTLRVPLDLGITRGVVVRAGGVPFVVITTAVLRLQRVGPADVRAVEGRLYLHDAAGLIPLADLDAVLGLSHRARPRADGEPAPCVVVAAGDRRAALRVDALIEERDVVVRPLGARVRRAAFVSGATVLGEGEVALVLDVADLVRLARPAPSEEAAEQPRRRRLLVVDDSVTTRQLERSILETAGYEVAVARDGQDAWEQILAGELFDLVVSDLEMPRLDGFGLLARIRAAARTARLPVVLVTARDSDADRQRAAEGGASAYVVKGGFDQEALLDTLEQLL